MKFMYFPMKYCYSDILLKKKHINFIYNHLFCCIHTCYSVNMVSVTSALRYITTASRYHPCYQSISSMYIRGLILRNFAELTDAVPIVEVRYGLLKYHERDNNLLQCYASRWGHLTSIEMSQVKMPSQDMVKMHCT